MSPFQGKSPEEWLAGFVADRGGGDPRARLTAEQQRRVREVAAAAAVIHDLDTAPEATLLGRSYEPPSMFVLLQRHVRGAGRSEAWGLHHVSGRWHPQTYGSKERAREVADSLTLLWLEGTETPLTVDFADARGEHETVEDWKQRQGIGAAWCGRCPNPRQPDPAHHPDGQKEHVP